MRRTMTKLLLVGAAGVMVAGMFAAPAGAGHEHPKFKQGPNCGSKWTENEDCSFTYEGGQLYVGASSTGTVVREAAGANVRLEARSRITGKRRVLLSCTIASTGACSTGGSFDVAEDLRRGQKLFCILDGVGRGNYECGTILRRN